MKKYLAMFLIIICSSFSVFGEEGQNKEINDLKQRIEQLERENKEVKIDYSAKELFEKNDKKIEEIEKDVQENRENILTWLPWKNVLNKGSFPTIIVLISIFLWAKKNMKDNLLKEVKNDIKEQVTSRVKKNIDDEVAIEIERQSREVSNKILNEYRERILSETILRLSKRILVLSKESGSNVFNDEFKKSYGFEKIKIEKIERIDLNNSNYDLIILNNEIPMNELNLAKLINENDRKNTVYLNYFPKGQSKIKDELNCEIIKKWNFTNSPITLYEQIMNSLKYQDFLEKSST